MMPKSLAICVLAAAAALNGVSAQLPSYPETDTCTGSLSVAINALTVKKISQTNSLVISRPGNLRDKTEDSQEVGAQSCGVSIDRPGIWYRFQGTGKRVRISTCDSNAPNGSTRTEVKAKISAFSGSCGALICIGGSSEPDFDCPFRTSNDPWGTIATAYELDTVKDRPYNVLIQGDAGDVYASVREVEKPRNDFCVNAAGPVPRDRTRVVGTLSGATLLSVPTCENQQTNFPGIWYQVVGTGDDITVGACSEFNQDGYQISVYHASGCDSLKCVSYTQSDLASADVPNSECTFPESQQPRAMSAVTFSTTDLDRYFVLVSSNQITSQQNNPGAEFRFYVDDGKDGKGGSGGAASIEYRGTGGGADGNADDKKNGSGGRSLASTSISTTLVAILGTAAFLLDFTR